MRTKVIKGIVIGFIALLTLPLLIQLFYVLKGEKELQVHQRQEMSFQDPQKVYTQKCAACHGLTGDGSEGYPRLNNQEAMTLASKIKGYKNGSYGTGSGAEIMKLQVADFGDPFIDQLAQVISVMKPNKVHEQNQTEIQQKKENAKFDPGMNS